MILKLSNRNIDSGQNRDKGRRKTVLLFSMIKRKFMKICGEGEDVSLKNAGKDVIDYPKRRRRRRHAETAAETKANVSTDQEVA